MKTYLMMVAKVFVFDTAATFALICILVLVIDFRLGSASPGIWAIAEDGSHGWIPVILVLMAAMFLYSCGHILVSARRGAAKAQMDLWHYLNLTPAQRTELLKDREKMN